MVEKKKLSSQQMIEKTIDFVREMNQNDFTGHDWWHIQRVRKLALKIATEEKADSFVVEMAALLHDISDYKFFPGNEQKGINILREFLGTLQLSSDLAQKIIDISTNISFMKTLPGEKKIPENVKTLEFMVVSDADRLDAMGAIGIARAFTYGGYYHRAIYDPNVPPDPDISQQEYQVTNAPSLNHFYEKLMKLRDFMYTSYGKKLACGRHQFLEQYLQHFYAEWEGEE